MNLISRETVRGLAKTANSAADVLFHATTDCDLGKVLVARSAKGVRAILLGDNRSDLEADLVKRFPEATLVSHGMMVRDDLAKVVRYVGDPSKGLDLALDMRGTPIQRRVWQALRSIPVGQTRTYMHVARLINGAYPTLGARVVANACAANPLALAVPCHRVIRSDGNLAGYRWGLVLKRELLNREAAA